MKSSIRFGVVGALLIASLPLMLWAQRRGETPVVAIRNVHVIPMDREAVLEDMTVIVRDGKIAAIGKTDDVAVPADARVVEGRGRYLTPGLTNMHVHVSASREHLLGMFVAHGVTTVRSMGATSEEAGRTLLQWREEVRSGNRLGPELVVSSQFTSRDDVPVFRRLTTSEEARDAVREYAAAGYDLVKVVTLDRDVFLALMDEARKQKIPVAGHNPSILLDILGGYPVTDLDFHQALTMDEVLGSGMVSLEHIEELFKVGMMRIPSEKELPGFVRRVRDSGIAITTMMIRPAYNNALLTDPDGFLTEERLEGVRQVLGEKFIERAKGSAEENKKLDEPTRRMRLDDLPFVFKMLKALQEEGVTILAGTDSGLFTHPGLSLHDEFALFIEAGLTPYETLRAATYNAAKVLGRLESSGTVEIGKSADLVLANENPLEDITSLRNPAGVMVRGRWLDREELDGLLEP